MTDTTTTEGCDHNPEEYAHSGTPGLRWRAMHSRHLTIAWNRARGFSSIADSLRHMDNISRIELPREHPADRPKNHAEDDRRRAFRPLLGYAVAWRHFLNEHGVRVRRRRRAPIAGAPSRSTTRQPTARTATHATR